MFDLQAPDGIPPLELLDAAALPRARPTELTGPRCPQTRAVGLAGTATAPHGSHRPHPRRRRRPRGDHERRARRAPGARPGDHVGLPGGLPLRGRAPRPGAGRLRRRRAAGRVGAAGGQARAPTRGRGSCSTAPPPARAATPTATSSSTTSRSPAATRSSAATPGSSWWSTSAASTAPTSTASRWTRRCWPTATRCRSASSGWSSSPGPRRGRRVAGSAVGDTARGRPSGGARGRSVAV